MQLLLTLWLWLFYFFAVEKNSSKCLLPYLEIEQKVRSIKIEKRMKHLFLKKQSNPDFCGLWWNLSLTLTAIFKHEYLRSRASTCVSLSSPASSHLLAIYWLSRYSCLYLGSLHPRIFLYKLCVHSNLP